jgi:hypothetical protein
MLLGFFESGSPGVWLYVDQYRPFLKCIKKYLKCIKTLCPFYAFLCFFGFNFQSRNRN